MTLVHSGAMMTWRQGREVVIMSHASPPPIVFVVDDDVSVRESLELLIRNEGWQAETFQSAQEFLAHARVVAPSCLVLDVTLPGLSGLDLQKRVLDRTDMPIIFITGYGDVPMTVQAMKAGAVEFLTKPFSADVLVDAIRNAIEHSRTTLAHEAEMRALRQRYASLTPREQQVMALVVAGLLNKQVGSDLGISEITVKAHRGSVMRKMEADSLGRTNCLILDIAMPGMSGPELQRELTRRMHRIPIVFITAHADEAVRPRSLERCVAQCLLKPFSESALIEALNAALGCS